MHTHATSSHGVCHTTHITDKKRVRDLYFCNLCLSIFNADLSCRNFLNVYVEIAGKIGLKFGQNASNLAVFLLKMFQFLFFLSKIRQSSNPRQSQASKRVLTVKEDCQASLERFSNEWPRLFLLLKAPKRCKQY